MVSLVLLLFGTQALCSWAASPPASEARAALLSPPCNTTAVEEAADLALRQINADRQEGYVLRLYRIFSVREHPQVTKRAHEATGSGLFRMFSTWDVSELAQNPHHQSWCKEISGSAFYLILDVVDTECHVLSKKLWKNCKARPAHRTVYGQCKAIIYINQARNTAHLNNYECILQPVPPKYIWSVCPDCSVDDSPTEPKYLEAAVQSLVKFNEESEQAHYFSVLNVTRASMQWVIGPAYFVEFLIQETSCSKSDTIADISKCKPLSLELAQVGFCKGSVVNSDLEHEQFVTISCEIYNLQDPATEEGKQQAEQTPGKSSQSHQEAFPSETNPFSPHLEKTVGSVKILPPSTEDMYFQRLSESQNKRKDGKPVLPEAVGPTSTLDGEKSQVDKSDLTKPVTGPVILPFPKELSLSDSCPGEAKERNSILQPLLPKKYTKV